MSVSKHRTDVVGREQREKWGKVEGRGEGERREKSETPELECLPKEFQSNWPELSHELDKAKK